MKAIRKYDGKEIDVILLHPKEYIDAEPDESGGKRIYQGEGLIVNEPVDWADFRRQAALNIYGITQAKTMTGDYEGLARNAVEQADILIKYLKEKVEND